MPAKVKPLVEPWWSLSLVALAHWITSNSLLTSKDNEGNEEDGQGTVIARPWLLVDTHSRDGGVHGVHPQLCSADLPQREGGQQDVVIVGSRLCPPAGTSSGRSNDGTNVCSSDSSSSMKAPAVTATRAAAVLS
jgi:hypothetical protein